MKRRLVITLFSVFWITACAAEYEPHNGDIIFQTSLSRQSDAIQKATKSKYSHVGIVYIKDRKPFVYEAVASVRLTPLTE